MKKWIISAVVIWASGSLFQHAISAQSYPLPFGAESSGQFDWWFRAPRGHGRQYRTHADTSTAEVRQSLGTGGSTKGLRHQELIQRRVVLERQLYTLQRDYLIACANSHGASARAEPFANVRPQQRSYWTLQDFYNGTMMDDRYLREPVVELSTASVRYGSIRSDIARSKTARDMLSFMIWSTNRQIATIDRELAKLKKRKAN